MNKQVSEDNKICASREQDPIDLTGNDNTQTSNTSAYKQASRTRFSSEVSLQEYLTFLALFIGAPNQNKRESSCGGI